jgi:hypothetical protein
VIARIHRANDVWASIHIDQPGLADRLVALPAVNVVGDVGRETQFLGTVDATSSNTVLVFSPTRRLDVGSVVAVTCDKEQILYQVTKAEIINVNVKGGGHQLVQAHAMQLGVPRQGPFRLGRHRWVPDPGAAVLEPPEYQTAAIDETRFLLGRLIGTQIPVYLDPVLVCEGHVAVLGMTRMGKTTLAIRLAKYLAKTRAVFVMDQTGEYRSRHAVAAYDVNLHDSQVGLSVFEPAAGQPTPDEGLKLFKHLANKGYTEYKTSQPFKRVLLVDEAHQFVPEPAVLGFGAPGRDSAITFGMYTMQVRKYGMTLVLVSQRTAVVAKSALSQCENVIAFKNVDQTGLDYLEAVLGSQAREILPNLRQGEALVCGPAMSSDYPVAISVDTSSAAEANEPAAAVIVAHEDDAGVAGPASALLEDG